MNVWVAVFLVAYAVVLLFLLYKGIIRNKGNRRSIVAIIFISILWPVAILFSGKGPKSGD